MGLRVKLWKGEGEGDVRHLGLILGLGLNCFQASAAMCYFSEDQLGPTLRCDLAVDVETPSANSHQ